MRVSCPALLILLAACSRAGSPEPPQAPARQAEYRGKLVVAGAEPATSVQLVGENGHLELVGSLEPELRRLAGAGVTVHGALAGQRPAQRLDVRSYEVTEIDGEVPSIGVLEHKDGQLRLAGKDTVLLEAVPEQLRTKDGAKIWIVGRRANGKLEVQSYGVISE